MTIKSIGFQTTIARRKSALGFTGGSLREYDQKLLTERPEFLRRNPKMPIMPPWMPYPMRFACSN